MVQGGVGTAHGAFGAFTSELFFGQAGHHDRHFMRRQCIGVMQHRCHRQILATHRSVNHHLQAFDGGEYIHRSPIATGAVVVQH